MILLFKKNSMLKKYKNIASGKIYKDHNHLL